VCTAQSSRVDARATCRGRLLTSLPSHSSLLSQPRLVAVSKTKPAAAVQEIYGLGHRHFGENYVNEICEKAPLLPSDIRWHFIGQLQSNKAKPLVLGVKNLYMVESVDSEKLAGLLEKGCVASGRALDDPLRVLVQVNTSGEPQKGGVEPGSAAALALYIRDSCPHLKFAGLMTIGELGVVASVFFERLVKERAAVAAALAVSGGSGASGSGGSGAASASEIESSLELSMGMSGDYELAIEYGSTNVRVGSSIFGAREYKTSKPKPQ
jgi:pyridoxal phosphate enzyme (YggS family)